MAAQKRMFDRSIVEQDKFMDLTMGSIALYFLLGMEADDEGFVSPRRVMRIYGCKEDDLRVLIAKRFVIAFESGVVVITDWNQNNYLDKNRIKPTRYKEEKKLISLTNDKVYVLNDCLTSIEESSIEQSSIEEIVAETPTKSIEKEIFNHWNEKKIAVHKTLTDKLKRVISTKIKQYSIEEVKKGIDTFAEVYHSKDTFWTHKWTLQEFLSRQNGFDVFICKTIADYKNKSFNKHENIIHTQSDKYQNIKVTTAQA